MHTVQLSDGVWQELQARAIPFVDKDPEDVIRRLLKETNSSSGQIKGSDAAAAALEEGDLVSHAGRIPHGSRLRATYKGREYHAEVRDGRVVWDGRRYSSISAAAVAVIQSTGSKRPTENGWRFWEVKDPETGDWQPGTDYRH